METILVYDDSGKANNIEVQEDNFYLYIDLAGSFIDICHLCNRFFYREDLEYLGLEPYGFTCKRCARKHYGE